MAGLADELSRQVFTLGTNARLHAFWLNGSFA
jgi:hypothetical protein